MWDNWVLNVTSGTEPPCFCPIQDDGRVVFGMNMIADRCTKNLVGVVHLDGQDAAEKWVSRNMDWKERFSRREDAK